jgi:hypothetical protein
MIRSQINDPMAKPAWRPMRWRTLLPIFLVLTGCSSEWTRQREFTAEVNSVYPQNYKSEIVALMRTYLNDPTGVRNAYISEPTQRSIEGVTRYTVCVRYDARTSRGQYAGSRDGMVLFRGGRLDHIADNEMARQQCRTASYAPFPELQQISR